jgi:YopX protein
MRDLKFRVRRKGGKLIGYIRFIKGHWQCALFEFDDSQAEDLKWVAGTLAGDIMEQFTGLKDKNGVGIAEGDIIKGDNPTVKVAEVIWDCLGFALRDASGQFGDLVAAPQYLGGNKLCEWVEIIGNVYANPELLH